ncbi:MAG: hypothetical protein ISS25_01125 [Nanoarchaeota archaeon]|nr:hypothetical protein [DPANN group archaeon]MBL7116416.1 hypothetical protein [Nanoarchaeota archaeon]
MRKFDILLPAGFETDIDKIERRKQRFLTNHHVHYLEGQPKGICIKIDGDYLLQRTINAYRNSRYVNNIFVIGPKWLYEDRIKDCFFIDYNVGLAENVIAGMRSLNENIVGVSPIDVLFETDHIDAYLESIEQHLGIDIIFQAVRRDALKGVDKGYDKPSYWLKENESAEKATRVIHGPLNISRTRVADNKMIHTMIEVFYSQRGKGIYRQFVDIARYVVRSPDINHKNVLARAIPKVSKFAKKQLTLEEFMDVLERCVIPRNDYKGRGKHFKVGIVPDEIAPAFGLDIDTLEEDELIHAEYTPIEKIVDLPYEEILRKSTISNSQPRHQSAHREESDSQILRADSQH